MAEYIKREAVLRAVHGQRSPCRSPAQNRMLDCLKAAVIRISAADVAPVVRCKGCKYSCKDRNGRTCEGYWYELSEFAVPVKDDDFCSYGEPMMDGGADHEAD